MNGILAATLMVGGTGLLIGILLGIAGKKLYEMLTFANAAAAIVITRRGALRVMPEKAEVQRFLAAHPA